MKNEKYDKWHDLNKGSFEPYFQPIININDGTCIGVEVLARLVRVEDSKVNVYPIPPISFTDFTEQKRITKEMLKKVILLIKDIPFPHDFKLSFNIPANIIAEDWLSLLCEDFLRSCNYNLKLILEITEHTPLTINNVAIKSWLSRLNNKNILIALDDFGTGHSNFTLVKALPIDIIKIPREFIESLPNGKVEGAIIDSIICLSQHSRIQLVAEGVESAKQSHWLVKKGINLQQGFYFSHPLNSTDLVLYLNKKINLDKKVDDSIRCSTKYRNAFDFPQSLLITCTRKHNLSLREEGVLSLISKGVSVSEISDLKHRSYKTIWAHKHNAYKKMGIKNDADFINYLHILASAI